ncbi:hypothetical protein THAOC_30336, partial [Thalassiosira oceanica]
SATTASRGEVSGGVEATQRIKEKSTPSQARKPEGPRGGGEQADDLSGNCIEDQFRASCNEQLRGGVRSEVWEIGHSYPMPA